MAQPRVHPNAAAAAAGDLEMGGNGGVFPPLPVRVQPASVNQQQLGGGGPHTWVGNDANTLLVVATLITTLTYQLGTSIPGGYWQQDTTAASRDGKEQVTYLAGDPIMRDLHRPRYVLCYCVCVYGSFRPRLGFCTSCVT